jgi:hypothetical protein
MSFYVKRTRIADGHVGWTGPIRSFNQARREFAAWRNCGWDAVIHDSTPELRREVRDWQRAANVRHGRIAS